MRLAVLSISMFEAVVLVSAVGGLISCSRKETTADEPKERGAYLVEVGGCHDCHSPKVFKGGAPEPDKSRLLSGHPAADKIPPTPAGVVGPAGWGAITSNHFTAWTGPWGVSFAANLTPHETGLGKWTPEDFIQTMRTGKHVGVGRPILPPMPWWNYAKMSEQDLRAMFTYLRTLPPVDNRVPEPVPPPEPPQASKGK